MVVWISEGSVACLEHHKVKEKSFNLPPCQLLDPCVVGSYYEPARETNRRIYNKCSCACPNTSPIIQSVRCNYYKVYNTFFWHIVNTMITMLGNLSVHDWFSLFYFRCTNITYHVMLLTLCQPNNHNEMNIVHLSYTLCLLSVQSSIPRLPHHCN